MDEFQRSNPNTLRNEASFCNNLESDFVMDISVVVVTSPSKSNPAITLIEQVINSLDCIAGVGDVPIIIVMDGYEVFGNVNDT